MIRTVLVAATLACAAPGPQIDPPRYADALRPVSGLADGYDLHTASLLQDGSVLLVGGRGISAVHQQALRYDPEANRFLPDALLITPRMAHAAAPLPDGTVLVTGGWDPRLPGTEFDPVFATTEMYSPAARAFSPGPQMTAPRRHHLMTPLADGRVLVTGGIQLRGSGFGASPATEIHAGGRFQEGQRMTVGRWLHTATLLPDGRVLIAGGRDNNCTAGCDVYSLRSAEIFDPATGAFTATGPMNVSRYGHSATLLRDGTVLIAGGESTEELGTGTDQVAPMEIYHPASGTFTKGPDLRLARSSHTATLLGDGRVLLAGGFRVSGVATERTEIFDPRTGVSLEGPAMSDFHVRHTATLLHSGAVLLFSGANGYQPVPFAERFE